MISTLINTFYLLIGLISMVPAFCIIHGLIRRYRGTLTEHQPSKYWWLGVCAEVSKNLGIHVVAVRFFVLLYTPLGLGLIFYFIYYWFIINRVSIPQLTPEHEIQITKINS
ncbi:MAG: PspC domain-containing protein, partial [SAR324 cluster bacterium]|nr:PspC domain-containing protein [SAR324 cluster bacterium]